MKPSSHKQRAGFTLVELMIATTILGVLGLGLTQGLKLADNTHSSVTEQATQNRQLRTSITNLRSELQSSTASLLQVTPGFRGNQILTLQIPIDGAGPATWGAFDRSLGNSAAEWNREGWQVRYRVTPDELGNVQLLREILDPAGTIQAARTLARGLLTNTDPQGPGLTAVQTGDVWQIRLATQREESNGIYSETFDVRLRN